MSDKLPRIRRATDEEVCEDMVFGGMQMQVPIDAPQRAALRRGMDHWGDPTPQYGPHEWVWRLRCGDLSLRVGICSRGAAWAMFNSYCQPGEDERDQIMAKLSKMLQDDQ